jgi:hypothetical protein
MPRALRARAGQGDAVVVSFRWIVDSISAFALLDPMPYLLKGRARILT